VILFSGDAHVRHLNWQYGERPQILSANLEKRSFAGLPEVPEEAEGRAPHARAGKAEENDQALQ